MVYNGYTIETNAEMSYEPDELTDWQSFVKSWKAFWNSPFGKYLSIQLFVAATALAVLCPAFAPMYASAVIGVGISLGVGAVIAGYRSLSQGNGFWEGFANHLNENWAQELAISMALAMVTFGVSLSGRWKHLKNRLFLRFFVALQPFFYTFDFPIWGKLGKTDLFILRIRIFLLRKAEIRPKNAYRHLTSLCYRRGARPKAKRAPAESRIPGLA